MVVSNVDALTTYRDLLPTPARLAQLGDRSLAGFVLLLGVRGETPALAHHTVFFPRCYDAVFGSARRRARPRSSTSMGRCFIGAVHLIRYAFPPIRVRCSDDFRNTFMEAAAA